MARCYLSQMKAMHIAKGKPFPEDRLAWQIINGRDNKKEEGRKRMAVSLAMMRHLRRAIGRKQQAGSLHVATLWCLATLLFNGSFRIEELLAEKSTTFVRDQTLLGKRIMRRYGLDERVGT